MNSEFATCTGVLLPLTVITGLSLDTLVCCIALTTVKTCAVASLSEHLPARWQVKRSPGP